MSFNVRIIATVVVAYFGIIVQPQKIATKSNSYFTVDNNAEHTSTQNWWGDNVDNGAELMITTSTISAGVNPASIEVVSVEPSTSTETFNLSSPKVAVENSNSSQSLALTSSAFSFSAIALIVLVIAN